MAKEKTEKEKRYKYIMKIVCKECETPSKNPWPCIKCRNTEFIRIYELVEVK